MDELEKGIIHKLRSGEPSKVSHHLSLWTLPSLEAGDYGCVVMWDWDHGLLFYDDDASGCICDAGDDCHVVDWDDVHKQGFNPYEVFVCECGQVECEKNVKDRRGHRISHTVSTEAVLYPASFHHTMDFHMEYIQAEYRHLSAFPENYTPPNTDGIPKRGGFVYAIAMNPDLSLHRIKFGFTSDLDSRLKAFRTGCPRLLVLGLWDADEEDEKWLLATLESDNPRIGNRGVRFKGSEEFDLYDPFQTLEVISLWLLEQQEERDAGDNY